MSRGDETGSQRLGQDQFVAGLGGGIGEYLLRMNDPRYTEPKLDFLVADRVSSDDGHPGFHTPLRSAAKDFAEPVQTLAVIGIADQIESRLGNSAHGIHVAQGIGSRDLAVDKRVIHDRRKEIQCLDEGYLVGQAVDTGVVVRVGSDKEIRIFNFRQMAQNLRYPLRG